MDSRRTPGPDGANLAGGMGASGLGVARAVGRGFPHQALAAEQVLWLMIDSPILLDNLSVNDANQDRNSVSNDPLGQGHSRPRPTPWSAAESVRRRKPGRRLKALIPRTSRNHAKASLHDCNTAVAARFGGGNPMTHEAR